MTAQELATQLQTLLPKDSCKPILMNGWVSGYDDIEVIAIEVIAIEVTEDAIILKWQDKW